MKDCMKTLGHVSLRLTFLVLLLTAFGAAAWWVQPSLFHAELTGAYKYQGKFVSGCTGTALEGINYRDVIDLEAINEKTLSVGYIKVFFSDKDCTPKGQLVQMKLPKGTWEIIAASAAEMNRTKADKMLVTLPDGKVDVVVKNPERAGQTDDAFYLRKDASSKPMLDIDKMTQGFTAKELHLIDGDRLYMHAHNAATDELGYPRELDKNDFFTRF